MRCCFCLKFNNSETIFPAARFMPTTCVSFAWHESNDMPISSANSPIVIQRLSKIIFFTASMFSWVVDVLGRPGWTLSLISSRPSLNRLYHNWTLCSAHSRLAKGHSQHFKCSCTFNLMFYPKLNTVSLVHFFRIVKNRRAHQSTANLFICQK